MLWPQPWPRPGQRVVLGEDPDPRAVGPEATGEATADRRVEAADGVLDGVAVTADDLRHPAGGLVLLEGRLGVRVDAVRQVEDLVAGALDRVGGAGLEVEERLGGRRGVVGSVMAAC